MALQDSLLDILRSSEIGSSNWTIANLILNYGNKLQNVSIQRLAEECHVSEPTISRFAKHVGCRNYIDLKSRAKYLGKENDLILFHMKKESIDQLSSHPREFMTQYSNMISNQLKKNSLFLDYKKIDDLIHQISSVKRVFLFGISTSLMLAEIIQSNLVNFNKVVYLGFTTEQQLNHIKNLKSTDLVIIISTYGNYIHQNSQLANQIIDTACKTVLLTQNSGIQETFIFDDVIYFSEKNNNESGPYSMLMGIEYLVRRYAILYKNSQKSNLGG